MPIVFDEVTGSVEPTRPGQQPSVPQAGATGAEASDPASSSRLRADLRRLHTRNLRLRAS